MSSSPLQRGFQVPTLPYELQSDEVQSKIANPESDYFINFTREGVAGIGLFSHNNRNLTPWEDIDKLEIYKDHVDWYQRLDEEVLAQGVKPEVVRIDLEPTDEKQTTCYKEYQALLMKWYREAPVLATVKDTRFSADGFIIVNDFHIPEMKFHGGTASTLREMKPKTNNAVATAPAFIGKYELLKKLKNGQMQLTDSAPKANPLIAQLQSSGRVDGNAYSNEQLLQSLSIVNTGAIPKQENMQQALVGSKGQ